MPSAEERFRAKVERRNGHEVWTGARDARGVGMVRIDGKLRTVQRAAWEFAYEPLPSGVRVNCCAVERACVRIDHLSLSPASAGRPVPRRRARGTGSVREVRRGVWEIAVTDGKTPAGQQRRRFSTIHGSRRTAEQALTELVRATSREDLGDLRVRELVGRYLEDQSGGQCVQPVRDPDRALLRDVIERSIGDDLAGVVTAAEIERALEQAVRDGMPLPDVRAALRLLRRSYQWAKRRSWRADDPTADIETRWLAR